ncbi:M48 family metallopeptidase [Thalassobaculum sp. OXR-137]|uniref:M48 family metallopeptidase n=1 Tax=Thalassobaculum sp. OXR-137 TaxID=3100173 RepID=UPI002AC9514F|nr:M48 family metallopeptidase [Thalassobaculum sp. OXR-137]WPZ36398.1 M48 family metallopeptidase [Thalassobaculum sp. OXR-137]
MAGSTGPRGNAHLLDGVTGADHRVAIVPDRSGLRLLPTDERAAQPQCPLLWRWERIYRPESAGEDAVFSLLDAEDARLVPDDPALAAAIRSRATGDARQAGTQVLGLKRRPTAAMAIGATAIALVLVLLALAPLSGMAARLLPPDTGSTSADNAIRSLTAAHKRCTGPDGYTALQALAGRLAGAADIPPPQITVLNWDLVNAFALPGGRIVLTSGLIKESREGSELAAVLAHEIAHVVHRDPMTAWIRREGVSLVLALLFGQEAGGSVASTLTGAVLDANYTRDQEERADHTALALLRDNDISSDGGRAFFERLQDDEIGGTLGSLLTLVQSHPGSADRAALFAAAETGTQPGIDSAQLAALKRMCS